MKKFLAFDKSYLAEILFALFAVLTLTASVCGIVFGKGLTPMLVIAAATLAQIIFGQTICRRFVPKINVNVWFGYYLLSAAVIGISSLAVDNAEAGVLGTAWSILLLVSSLCWNRQVRQTQPGGPFLMPVKSKLPADNYGSGDDPIPEPAEKLPYVYYDHPVEQAAHNIYYYSPYLGMERSIPFRPRKERGKKFDNVRGILVVDDLVLLRSILFTSNFPDDIREMAKHYDGRFPTEAEIKQIYAKFKEINQNLYECGEPLLRKWKYLYTSGDEKADRVMNYCLNFANGQETLADCDSFVCAVLVAKKPIDVQKLEAALKEFKAKHLEKPAVGNAFDVLCEVDGQNVRLPFAKRYIGKPVGIFPFKCEPEYLELDEIENKKHTDADVDESRLPDEQFCERVYSLKNQLNVYLQALGKPILEGEYLADCTYMRGCGWIIGFEDNKFNTLSADYYGGNTPAKLRYMGRFTDKCKE